MSLQNEKYLKIQKSNYLAIKHLYHSTDFTDPYSFILFDGPCSNSSANRALLLGDRLIALRIAVFRILSSPEGRGIQ